MTHELGHVLGYEHDVMGDTLAVGERDLPFDDQADDGTPFDVDPDADTLLS